MSAKKPSRVSFMPDRWESGVNMLSHDEEYVYFRICLFIWAHGRSVQPDEIGAACRFRSDSDRISEILVRKGKLVRNADGGLSNDKAMKEYGRARAVSESSRRANELRWAEKNRISETDPIGLRSDIRTDSDRISERNPSPTPSPIRDPSVPDGTDGRPSGPDPFELAVQGWNDLAGRLGLAKVQRLTDARKSKLRNRLAECGGIEGWNAALARVEASAFLRGDKTDWKCDFDFLLQAKSFTKLMEGAYDDGPRNGTANPGHTRASGSFAAATAAAAEILDRARTGHGPLDRAAGDHPGGQGLDPFGDP